MSPILLHPSHLSLSQSNLLSDHPSVVVLDSRCAMVVQFRKDSTGIPHILEYIVLWGSRKYPLKEPFVELLKGSLHTFLNAFTYPDRTCYPAASTNMKDFYNLVDVYLDAVFFPKCVEDFSDFSARGLAL